MFDIYVKELGGPLLPGADVAITIAEPPDPVVVGRRLAYTMTVVNHGPEAATGTTLTGTLPASSTFVAVTASRGNCTVQMTAQTVTCDLGTLAAHTSPVVRLVVRPLRVGTISFTAAVSANESDADPTNNPAAVSVTIPAG